MTETLITLLHPPRRPTEAGFPHTLSDKARPVSPLPRRRLDPPGFTMARPVRAGGAGDRPDAALRRHPVRPANPGSEPGAAR